MSTMIIPVTPPSPCASIISLFIQCYTKKQQRRQHCTALLLFSEPISNNCSSSSHTPQPMLTLFIRHGLRSEHCNPNPSGFCPCVPMAQFSWLLPQNTIRWGKPDSSLWKAWKHSWKTFIMKVCLLYKCTLPPTFTWAHVAQNKIVGKLNGCADTQTSPHHTITLRNYCFQKPWITVRKHVPCLIFW